MDSNIYNLKKMSCPFCFPEPERELILESENVYAIYDKFPVSKGHVLIIPKKHCSNYFDLQLEEQCDCIQLLSQVKEIIQRNFNPDGYNIGININESAGQTINHVHIHLIPRYQGDMAEPRGGVRGVIPEKRNY